MGCQREVRPRRHVACCGSCWFYPHYFICLIRANTPHQRGERRRATVSDLVASLISLRVRKPSSRRLALADQARTAPPLRKGADGPIHGFSHEPGAKGSHSGHGCRFHAHCAELAV